MSIKKSKKTLLLNPPGIKKYFRDYYCSKISKAKYYYHPIDLVYLSGTLDEISEVFLIDAIADDIQTENCIKKILEINPDYIISLCSAPSLNEDILFLNDLKESLPEVKLIGTGDILRDNPRLFLEEHKFIDAVLSDFSKHDIIKYIELDTKDELANITYRVNDEIIIQKKNIHDTNFHVPTPLWSVFKPVKYRFPFSKHKTFASILTDFGCPYKCDFCPISKLNFKLRDIEDVIKELKALKKLNIKELYIRDQTFGVNKKRSKELLSRIIEEDFEFTWTCLSRLDVIDSSILPLMKKAGCHTIMIGIESASNELINTHNKAISADLQIHEVINKIKKHKIDIGGFFMIGFPEENKSSIESTIKLACSLNLDYASFNIVTPRFGTEFRQDVIKHKKLNKTQSFSESSETVPKWKEPSVNSTELLKIKNKAIRKFYLRPSYILKQVLKKRTLWEITSIINQSISLLRKSRNKT